MSGSAKAGTTAERHTCELRVLITSIVRAPPKRASGESFSPLTKDLHLLLFGSLRFARHPPISDAGCGHHSLPSRLPGTNPQVFRCPLLFRFSGGVVQHVKAGSFRAVQRS